MLAITTERRINTVLQYTLCAHNVEAVSNGSLHSQKVDIVTLEEIRLLPMQSETPISICTP